MEWRATIFNKFERGHSMSEMLYQNDVIGQGVIVHKYSTPKVTILTVSTGRATSVPNYPKFVCFNEAKEKADKMNERDHVTILGNVQSSVRTREDRRYITQAIYADDVYETPRAMEKAFGIKNGEYEGPVNQVSIAGELASVATPTDNILRITVRTVKNGRRSNVRAFYFTNRAKEIAESLKPGDNVCFIGTIQTTKKDRPIDGTDEVETVHYENVVIRSLRKKED